MTQQHHFFWWFPPLPNFSWASSPLNFSWSKWCQFPVHLPSANQTSTPVYDCYGPTTSQYWYWWITRLSRPHYKLMCYGLHPSFNSSLKDLNGTGWILSRLRTRCLAVCSQTLYSFNFKCSVTNYCVFASSFLFLGLRNGVYFKTCFAFCLSSLSSNQISLEVGSAW